LSESAWREYLAGAGKLPTGIKLERSAAPTFDADTGMASLFNAISAALPVAVHAAIEHGGVKLPRRKLDQLTFDVWLLLAGVYEKIAPRFDANGPFTPVDGRAEYPDEIRRIAARLVTQKKPVKSTVSGQLPPAKQAAA
jgi:hypothetical protein